MNEIEIGMAKHLFWYKLRNISLNYKHSIILLLLALTSCTAPSKISDKIVEINHQAIKSSESQQQPSDKEQQFQHIENSNAQLD